MRLEYGILNWFLSLVQMLDRQEKTLSKLWYSTETFFKTNNHNFYLNMGRIKANTAYGARGPFLESPVNFSGLKSNIQIEIKRIRARVLAGKQLHFVSLTDSFIMLDAKLLKPRSLMATETAYRAR